MVAITNTEENHEKHENHVTMINNYNYGDLANENHVNHENHFLMMIGKVERAQDMNTNGFLTLRSLKMIRHHFVKLNAIIIIYMLPTRVLSWGMFYG